MSNAIRYDSLLVRELARELDATLTGARLDGAFFDRERLRLTLQLRAPQRGRHDPPSLLWQLHPSSGHLTAAPAGAGAGRAQLPAGARVASVSAPPDERIIVFDIAGAEAAGTLRRIVVELLTNQWNACGIAADGRILALLRERDTVDRTLRAGMQWVEPRSSGRPGARRALAPGEWQAALGPVPPGERLRALPRLVAWASPQNAAWIMGDADVTDAPAALERAYRRYVDLAWGGALRPVLLEASGGWQPYVSAGQTAEPMPSLLHAFAEAARRAQAAPSAAEDVEAALAAVAQRLDALDRRERRLQEEQAGAAGEAARLRLHADLLLSQLHAVVRGAASAVLDDYEGGRVEIELDPSLGPAENAAQLYDTARRRDRAAARIPSLLDRVVRERARLHALAGRIRDGAASPDDLQRLRVPRPAGGRAVAPPPLPYRRYRTSGGLEVRVGRGSRANDDLTFRHSSPNDVWLHARDVAGAHVILRWAQADENPPARDLAEAAVLAALHSRARTSGTVPVDWTRRKYVRKPRKAGPGLVVPERVRTLFVAPDADLEIRLREEAEV